MADTARQLPTQDASRYHRWLQDDAVKLQVQEVLGSWDLFQFAPDPMKARALFVGLCFIRLSHDFRCALDDEVEKLRHQPNWITFTSWWTMRQYDVIRHPEDYPFALTDDEFDDYSIKNFGGQFPYIRSTYHPPNFYRALLGDIISLVIAAGASRFADVVIPRIAGVGSLAEAGWAGAAVKQGAKVAGGAAAQKLFPGGSWDASKKDMIFPRYVLESNRRVLD